MVSKTKDCDEAMTCKSKPMDIFANYKITTTDVDGKVSVLTLSSNERPKLVLTRDIGSYIN